MLILLTMLKIFFQVFIYYVLRVSFYYIFRDTLLSIILELILLCFFIFKYKKINLISKFEYKILNIISSIFIFFGLLLSLIFLHENNILPINEINYKSILVYAILAPISEEIFFRLYLLRFFFEKTYKQIVIVFFTSLLFTIIHFKPNIYENLHYFIFSILLCYFYLKYKNIYFTILLHITWNLIVNLNILYLIKKLDLPILFFQIILIISLSLLIINLLNDVKYKKR